MPLIAKPLTKISLGLMLCASAFTVIAREYPALKEVGAGKNSYQFVLKDPVTNKALPNTRYRLFAYETPIKGVENYPETNVGVVYGTTDANGKTAKVKVAKKVASRDWVLNRVVGKGSKGEAFYMPAANADYAIDVDGSLVYCGKADANGNTDFLTVNGDHRLDSYELDPLSEADLAFCQQNLTAMDAFPADVTPAQSFDALAGLYRPVADQLSKGLVKIVSTKLLALSIATKDEGKVAYAVEERLKEGNDADILNNIGYDLIDGNMLVEKGVALVDKALEQRPDDFYAQDSKGWALFKLGKTQDALVWLKKSYDTYNKTDGNDTAALIENLAHLAEVQYQLGNKEEATKLLNKGYEQDPSSTLIADTAKRLNISLEDAEVPVIAEPPPAI